MQEWAVLMDLMYKITPGTLLGIVVTSCLDPLVDSSYFIRPVKFAIVGPERIPMKHEKLPQYPYNKLI